MPNGLADSYHHSVSVMSYAALLLFHCVQVTQITDDYNTFVHDLDLLFPSKWYCHGRSHPKSLHLAPHFVCKLNLLSFAWAFCTVQASIPRSGPRSLHRCSGELYFSLALPQSFFSLVVPFHHLFSIACRRDVCIPCACGRACAETAGRASFRRRLSFRTRRWQNLQPRATTDSNRRGEVLQAPRKSSRSRRKCWPASTQVLRRMPFRARRYRRRDL